MSMEQIKNFPMLLKAFCRVRAAVPDACLMVAGDGTQLESLRALAAELGLGDAVRFLGMRFDMPEIYRLMDVFALTSFTEGISVTVVEAMASSVPCVVTRVGGNPEVVQEAETGYLVPLGDEELLARRVVDLLRDPQLAARLGGEGRARAAAQFSFGSMMAAYHGLYRECRKEAPAAAKAADADRQGVR